jgi:hypothetical protein
MIFRHRNGIALAPLAWNLCVVTNDLPAEQRRRWPCFVYTINHRVSGEHNVGAVLKSSAAIRRRRDRTRFAASTVRRRLNRCRNPRGAWDLSVARAWPSKSNDCSSVFERSGARSCQCFVGGSGNDAVGSIQARIRIAPTRRRVLIRRCPDSERSVHRRFPNKPSALFAFVVRSVGRRPCSESIWSSPSIFPAGVASKTGGGSLIETPSSLSELSKGVW